MGAPKQPHQSGIWLTLEQASERLGVHSTTLRRWANEGAIDTFVTPGGHRRFRVADVERFAQGRSTPCLPVRAEQGLIDSALAQTRQEIPKQRWVEAYQEEDRENHRQLGRQLMGLVLQYLARPDDCPELLREARLNGEQHGRWGVARGHSLVDLLQAVSFFRTTMVETALLQLPHSIETRSESGVRLLRRIERLLSEVQAGVVEIYGGK